MSNMERKGIKFEDGTTQSNLLTYFGISPNIQNYSNQSIKRKKRNSISLNNISKNYQISNYIKPTNKDTVQRKKNFDQLKLQINQDLENFSLKPKNDFNLPLSIEKQPKDLNNLKNLIGFKKIEKNNEIIGYADEKGCVILVLSENFLSNVFQIDSKSKFIEIEYKTNIFNYINYIIGSDLITILDSSYLISDIAKVFQIFLEFSENPNKLILIKSKTDLLLFSDFKNIYILISPIENHDINPLNISDLKDFAKNLRFQEKKSFEDILLLNEEYKRNNDFMINNFLIKYGMIENIEILENKKALYRIIEEIDELK